MSYLGLFALLAVGTYTIRSVFILVVGDRSLPPVIESAIRNVGPSVLAALVVSMVMADGVAAFVTDPAEVVAILLTVYVGWRTRSFLPAFLWGGTALFLLDILLG